MLQSSAGNDYDPDGDPFEVTSLTVTSTNGAAITMQPGGGFFYDPTSAPALQALANGEQIDDTFTYTIEDSDGLTDSATVTVRVLGWNDAPVLDNSGAPFLDTGETTIETLISRLGGTGITDVDNGAQAGIAIIEAEDSDGTWEYTIDNGTNWATFPAYSSAVPFLLTSDGTNTRVRFIPDANAEGNINFRFRAWDTTQGSNGGTFTMGTPGGSSAFSTDIETATLTVNKVGAPDNNLSIIANGDAEIINISSNPIVADGNTSDYDLAYYEWGKPDGIADHILMDMAIISISTDGTTWYPIFNWGDGSKDMNTNLCRTYEDNTPCDTTEADNEVVNSVPYLYGTFPYQTGTLFDVDSLVPADTYNYIKVEAPTTIGDTDGGIEYDSFEVCTVASPCTYP